MRSDPARLAGALAVTVALLAAPGAVRPLAAQGGPGDGGGAAAPAPGAGAGGDGAAAGGVLRVVVRGFHSDAGRARCDLYRGPTGFPVERQHTVMRRAAPIRNGHATCVFRGVPAGEYAVAVIHDEDDDAHFDRDVFGRPQEGWGASRDAEPRPFGPPRYDDAKLAFDGTELRIAIRMRY